MPTTSVVITTHNRPHLLPRAILSAQAAGADVEVVVVDDASNDETARVCRSLSGIRYVRVERNQQVAGARNIGILNSTGDYLAFLDDDDVRLAGSLDLQAAALSSAPEAGLIYGQALIGNGQRNAQQFAPETFYPRHCPHGDIFWELLEQNFIPCGAVVFRRSCLLRVGLLDESAPGIDDWDLWIRIAELYPVLATEQAVAIWRQPTPTSGQFSFRADGMHRQARRLHRDKWLHLPRVVEAGAARRREATRAFSACASQQLVWEAAARLKARRLPDFARVALAAACMYPVGVSRKILSSSTWLSLMSGVGNWRRGERT